MLKRFFDVSVCLFILPFSCPLFVVISILIKLNSPGPVFYRGMRTGLSGTPFKIFKFRTMQLDAEKSGGGTTALNDHRIFRFGAFLRKCKLDELPQILNVIKGDMSLVGPRPELLQYTSQYSEEESLILTVRPGITDFSSIEFISLDKIVGEVGADKIFEERVLKKKNSLRLKYVNEQSFLLDIKLIFQTIYCIFKKNIQQVRY